MGEFFEMSWNAWNLEKQKHVIKTLVNFNGFFTGNQSYSLNQVCLRIIHRTL